ncbi:CBO0543 family protein [Bacillus marasmi]|uniref:CBO0543 family protein n=1 Tax=Bacillus marasmi TaxID=1926279 RepID=UPI0011C80826|nr:CBO0543 family protein [Bacillus marasmi]
MNTAKRLKNLKSQSSQKKLLRFGVNNELLLTIVFGSFVATYLDLFFVGMGMYRFGFRPFPDIFSINILFTLFVLPLSLLLYLTYISKLRGWRISGIILLLSLLGAVFERFAEKLGWFIHHMNWEHYYSVIGYFVYLHLLLFMYKWVVKRKN